VKKRSRTAVWAVFAVYCLVMLWLLFHRASRMTYLPYWDTVRANLNLVPFRTMRLFWRSFSFMPRAAAINLAGNVAVFIPLGILLPALWKGQQKLWRFALTVIAAVAVIEVTQLFTMTGSCDVDDLILNFAGALIGFGVFSVPGVKRRLRAGGFAP
jgi:glycopeptide antibiotics resistance protein